MLKVGFFLFKEMFEGKKYYAKVFHPHTKDELFLEPCMNLLFKFLYYYCAYYRKVWEIMSKTEREQIKNITFLSKYEIYNTVFFVCMKYDVFFPFLYEKN